MVVPNEVPGAQWTRPEPPSRLLAIPAEAGVQLAAVPKGRSKQRRDTPLSLLRVEAQSGASYSIVLGKQDR